MSETLRKLKRLGRAAIDGGLECRQCGEYVEGRLPPTVLTNLGRHTRDEHPDAYDVPPPRTSGK